MRHADDTSRSTLALLVATAFALTAVGCDGGGGGSTSAPSDANGRDTASDVTPDGGDAAEPDVPPRDTTADTAEADAAGGPSSCLDPAFEGSKPETCQSEPRPARCDASVETFSDWGPASVVSRLELTSTRAKNKALDLDGDDTPDNNMAGVLSLLSFFNIDIDQRIQNEIDNGDLLLVLEHQTGGSDLSNPFPINPLRGTFADDAKTDVDTSGTPYEIRTTSFASGTFPHTRIPGAKLNGAQFTAGPGRLNLALELSYFDVTVPIRGVRMRSTGGVLGDSPADQGVDLSLGRLGGYVLLRDLYGLFDQLYSQCACLDFPKDVFTVPNPSGSDPDICPGGLTAGSCEVSCTASAKQKASACSKKEDGSICGNLTRACNAADLIKNRADLDVDCDGVKDAISLGAFIEASGGVIRGVSETVAASSQSVAATNPTLTVRHAYLKKKRWLVLRAVGKDGSPAGVFGHSSSPLSAGIHSDVSIEVEGELKDGWGLFAVLHRSDGDGTFEYDDAAGNNDDGPVVAPRGKPVSSRFVVDVQ
ncbi:MAG: hypothetical protein ABEL76_02195 [Bradymonadaceae bacterium]